MKKKTTPTPKTGSKRVTTAKPTLRQEAEARLNEKESEIFPDSELDSRRLLHELQVHQIELEMVNDELVRTRAELEESRARYFNLFDLAPVGILTLNGEGLIQETNLTAASQLGLTRELLVNRKLAELILKEDRELYHLHFRQLFDSNISQDYEMRMQCADGSMIWVRAKSTISEGEKDTRLSQVILSNITRSKQAEQTLESNAIILQQLFDEMASGFALHEIICDASGKPVDYRFLKMNLAFERLTGLVGKEVVGKRVLEVFPETEPYWIEIYGRVALTGQPERYENYSQALDKTFSVVAYCPERGQFAVLFEDVTRNKQSEEALRLSQARYQNLVETAQDLIWQCDIEGRYVYLNPAWEQVFGYKLDEMLGKRFVDFQAPEYAERDLSEFKRLLKGEIVKGLETVYLGRDKRQIHLVFNAKQLLDAEGKPAGTQGTAYDITRRKQAEEELQFKNKLVHITSEMAKVGGWEFDAQTLEGTWTDEVARIHDLDPSLPTNVNLGLGFYLPESRLKIEQSISEAIESKKPYDLELQMVSAKGNLKWVRTMGLPIIEDGKVVKLRGIFQDITVRKQVEDKVRRSEAELKKAQAYAHVGSWIWDIKTGKLEWSDEMYNIFGISKESFSGKLEEVVADAIHPDDRQKVETANSLVANESKAIPLEYRILHPDGSQRVVWAEAGELEKDAEGKPALLRGIVMDITERKKAEDAVKAERNFARQIMNSMGQGLTVTDPHGCFEYVNPVYAKMIGCNPEDLLGKAPRDLTAPGSIAILEQAAARRRLGETTTYEIDLVHSDGHTVPVIITGVPRREAGRITGTIAVITDLTERKQAEEQLKKSELQFKTLFDNASIGIIICNLIRDNNGKIVDYIHLQANKAIQTHAGLTEDDVVGKKCSEVIPPEETASFIKMLTSVLETDDPYSYEQIFPSLGRTIENRPFILEKDLFAITFFDITERKKAEEKLQESERRYRERATELETIMDIVPVALWVAQDPACHVVFGNRTANELHRIQPGQNASMTQKTGQQLRPGLLKISHDGVEIEPKELPLQISASKGIEILNFESQIEFEDGTVTHEIGNTRPLFDESGRPRGAVGAFTDITRQKQVEKEIRRRAEELDGLQKTVLDITAAQSLPGLLESIVERACQLLGAPGGGLYTIDIDKGEVRCDVSYNTPANYTGVVLKYGEGVAGRVAQTGEPLYVEDYKNWEGRAESFDQERPFSIVLGVPLLWGGQVRGVINVLHFEEGKSFNQADIDLLKIFAGHAAIAIENSRLLEASQAGEAQIRALSTRLAEAEENERRRIARELHDQVGQSLSALSINMNIMHSQIPEYLPGFKRRLDDSLMLIDQTTDHIRNLMSELRPAVLDDYGLKAALDWMAGSIANRTNLKLLVEGECNRFPPRVEIALFRIAQEALGNISRHADARIVKILLTQDGPDMSLSVTDDGVGFDPSAVAATDKSGWGLRLMAERAESIGASLQVESTSGQGTCITVKYHDDNSTGG